MDAKKCDRCGKIYGNMDKSEVLNKMIEFTPRTIVFPRNSLRSSNLEVECCPECMEEIYLFVKKSQK